MGKTVIVYKSKYGAAKQYARWLSEHYACPLLENKGLGAKDLETFHTIILCGGIYAGGVAGISLLQKNAAQLKGKTLAVLAVGASPFDENAIAEVQKRAALPDAAFYYCRGAWDESKMKFGDKALCSMLKKMVAKLDPASFTPWQAALAESFGKVCDWTDEKSLAPLYQAIAG